MSAADTAAAAPSEPRVAEFAQTPEEVATDGLFRGRRIPWWFGPFAWPFALLTPARFGAWATASGIAPALFAHVATLLFAAGYDWSKNMGYGHSGNPPLDDPFTAMREALAAVVMLAHQGSGFVLGPLVFFELLILALSLPLTSFVAAGEPPLRAWWRSLKLLYWSSTIVAPAVWLATHLSADGRRPPDSVVLAFPAAILVAWFIVFVRLGLRFCGNPRGARWRPRAVRCHGCGYSLAMLPTAGLCPECAATVAASLPERRPPTAWAAARGPVASVAAFARTSRAALGQHDFGHRLRIWRDVASARWFACWHFLLAGVVAAFGTAVIWPRHLDELLIGHSGRFEDALVAGLLGAGLALAVHSLCHWLVAYAGFRDHYPRAAVVCYASPWLPVVALLTMAGLGAIGQVYRFRPFPVVRASENYVFDTEMLYLIGCLLPAIFALIFYLGRITTLLRQTRHAPV